MIVACFNIKAADGSLADPSSGPGRHSWGRGRGRHVRVHCRARLSGTACLSIEEDCSELLLGMAGIVVIFLSHVRSALVVVVGCAIVYWILMIWQGRVRTVLTVAFWG